MKFYNIQTQIISESISNINQPQKYDFFYQSKVHSHIQILHLLNSNLEDLQNLMIAFKPQRQKQKQLIVKENKNKTIRKQKQYSKNQIKRLQVKQKQIVVKQFEILESANDPENKLILKMKDDKQFNVFGQSNLPQFRALTPFDADLQEQAQIQKIKTSQRKNQLNKLILNQLEYSYDQNYQQNSRKKQFSTQALTHLNIHQVKCINTMWKQIILQKINAIE